LEEEVQDFTKLATWQKAHSLVIAAYIATASFPKDELYGLTSQIRRACTSIPANIAEGCGREGRAELRRFLQIAQGSASELEYHLLLARDLKFLEQKDYDVLRGQLVEVRRMLTSFVQKLNSTPPLLNTKN
jgi:four helix bundle protein